MVGLLIALAVVASLVGAVGWVILRTDPRITAMPPAEPEAFGWPVRPDESIAEPYRRGPSPVAGSLSGRR